MKYRLLVLGIILLFTLKTHSQENRVEGKIIKEYGSTFKVINPDINTNTSADLKVIFDVSQSADNKEEINKSIETAARFLNMHADAGFSNNQLKVAMTIHGAAWQDVLTDKAYYEKFGMDNPNSGLINALSNAGVDIIICGQTASFRKMEKDDINPRVKMALSAMTALIQYQNSGYKFIKF